MIIMSKARKIALFAFLALVGLACGNTPEIQAILDDHPELSNLNNLETAKRKSRLVSDGEPSTFAEGGPISITQRYESKDNRTPEQVVAEIVDLAMTLEWDLTELELDSGLPAWNGCLNNTALWIGVSTETGAEVASTSMSPADCSLRATTTSG